VPRHLALIYSYTSHALYTGSNRVEVIAAICLQCGYTAFYALDLEKLREESQQHPERLVRYPLH